MKRLVSLFFSLILLGSYQVQAAQLLYPDFEASMLRENKETDKNDKQYLNRLKLYRSANKNFVHLFKTMYENNIRLLEESSCVENYRIPRIIHQIWLGSEVPEKYYAWMQTWKNLAGWEYWLWTDEDVKHLKLYNRDLYDATNSFAEKSDILRLEILKRYGGVYVDTDYECVKPEFIEELHRCFDFYIGFEPLEHAFVHKFKMFKFCNAIVGSIPGHALLSDLIENLKANFLAYQTHCGPVEKTGPSYVTRIICEYELSHAHHDRNMYLPCTVFYPIPHPDIQPFDAYTTAISDLFPEAAGIHYWSGSWYKTDGYNKDNK